MRTEFSTLDIVKALDIPRERLRDWMNRGFISPSVSADGQGTKAEFTISDVHAVALFRLLVEKGFSRSIAGEYIEGFMKQEKSLADKFKAAFIKFKVHNEKMYSETLNDVPEVECPAMWKLDFKTGATELFDSKRQNLTITENAEGDDWDIILCVNVKRLFQEVDLALSKM